MGTPWYSQIIPFSSDVPWFSIINWGNHMVFVTHFWAHHPKSTTCGFLLGGEIDQASNSMMSNLQRNFGRLYAAQQRYNEALRWKKSHGDDQRTGWSQYIVTISGRDLWMSLRFWDVLCRLCSKSGMQIVHECESCSKKSNLDFGWFWCSCDLAKWRLVVFVAGFASLCHSLPWHVSSSRVLDVWHLAAMLRSEGFQVIRGFPKSSKAIYGNFSIENYGFRMF